MFEENRLIGVTSRESHLEKDGGYFVVPGATRLLLESTIAPYSMTYSATRLIGQ
jgi:hypothetical protein